MDSITAQEIFLETPMSPMREPFSPMKAEQVLSPAIIAVHDDHDEIVETIHDVVDHHPLQHPEVDDRLVEDAPELSSENENDVEDDDSASLSSYSPPSTPLPTALITLTPAHLNHLNQQFEHMAPHDILRHCQVLFPNLYQTTAFGLSGLAILDMFSKQPSPFSDAHHHLIFLDTLHHFPETLDLVSRVRERYSTTTEIHTFKPTNCASASDFATLHGSTKLWESDSERYDFLAKVEPQQRADRELDVGAVVTGRRRSQGGERAQLPIIELVSETGMIKINPLAKWSFEEVKEYIDKQGVPYNALLDKGYRSVGDWHSTQPVKEGEGEREGRWKGQQGKTECGIHNKKSRYAVFLMEMARKEEEERVAREKEEREMNKRQKVEDDDIVAKKGEVQQEDKIPSPEPAVSASIDVELLPIISETPSSDPSTLSEAETFVPEPLTLPTEKVGGKGIVAMANTTTTSEPREEAQTATTGMKEDKTEVSTNRVGFQPWTNLYSTC